MLDRFYASTNECDEDTWLDWAEDLKDSGHFAEALQVLEAYERNSPVPMADLSVYLDVLFLLQRFEKVCALVDAAKNGDSVWHLCYHTHLPPQMRPYRRSARLRCRHDERRLH